MTRTERNKLASELVIRIDRYVEQIIPMRYKDGKEAGRDEWGPVGTESARNAANLITVLNYLRSDG